MSIKLSRYAQRSVKRKKFVAVSTTFYTEDGPAVGTTWLDVESNSLHAMCVTKVTKATVYLEADDWRPIGVFMERVHSGRYVLIGVTPEIHTRVET